MLAEALLANATGKRAYPCANVDVGTIDVRPVVQERRGFRSAADAAQAEKHREELRVASRFSLFSERRRKFETFPVIENPDPPPAGGRRDDVTLPQYEGGRALVIKYVHDSMRSIFPPLPERSFEHIPVLAPESPDRAVVDVRDVRVTCPWEPYKVDGTADGTAADRPLPASPFRERTSVFDVYPPQALPQLLQRLRNGAFAKGPNFDPLACVSDRPLDQFERDALSLESTRRTMHSCPPSIATVVNSKFLSCSSSKTHAGTVKYRRQLKLKALGNVPEQEVSASNMSGLFSTSQRTRSVKVFGTYLQ